MARVETMIVRGTIDNIIFYEFRGTQAMRSKPRKVRQTKATKAKALLFGKAASISAALRRNFSSLIPEDGKAKSMYLLNTALMQWLGTKESSSTKLLTRLSFIDNLQFNTVTPLGYRLQHPIITDWSKKGVVKLRIPEWKSGGGGVMPVDAVSVKWEFVVTGCDIADPYQKVKFNKAAIEIPYDGKLVPAQEVELPFDLIEGGVHIVVAALKYMVDKKGRTVLRDEEAWMPVGVVGSCFSSY